MEVSQPSGRAARIGAALFVIILLVVAALIFVGIYIAYGSNHTSAIIAIGSLSFVFGIISYFARALTSDPSAPRALTWGFGSLGFVLLFAAVGFGPGYSGSRLVGIIVLLLLLGIAVGGAVWSARGRASVAERDTARRSWASRPPPSALTYSTAVGSPEASTPPPKTPGGAP